MGVMARGTIAEYPATDISTSEAGSKVTVYYLPDTSGQCIS